MEGVWAVVIVAGMFCVFSLACLAFLARTTWHAMNRRLDLERLSASIQLARSSETLPLAATIAAEDNAHRNMVRVPLSGARTGSMPPGDGEAYAGAMQIPFDDGE